MFLRESFCAKITEEGHVDGRYPAIFTKMLMTWREGNVYTDYGNMDPELQADQGHEDPGY